MIANAYAALGPGQALQPFSVERRTPGPKDVLIRIDYCGVCHSDIHQVRADWGSAHPSRYPMVPGHEIVGTVEEIGSAVGLHKIGDTVGVGCMIDSCRVCQECDLGEEQFCENGLTPTYNSVERDGKTETFGGYSTHIVVNEHFVLRIPEGLSPAHAAPLLCAGITTYSPLRHWNVRPGSQVAVIGLGGLGHIAVKLAKAFGAEVTVLSQSESKRADALRLGAKDFIVTTDQNAFDAISPRFDVILNTVAHTIDYDGYLNLLRRDGAMVLLGINSEGAMAISPGSVMIGRRKLTGSGIGGIRETQEMLDFCRDHGLQADIEMISMADIDTAFERILKSDVHYRFVIDMKTLTK